MLRTGRLTTLLFSLIVSGATHSASLDDKALKELLNQHKINGNPVADHPVSDLNAPLTQLGKKLFFSPDLSLDGSIACATCHHPSLAGADGLALPVGVTIKDPFLIGPPRLHQFIESHPDDFTHQLIPRNSPTVFNSSLYQKNLFWDGRVEYHQKGDSRNTIKSTIKVGGGFSELPTVPYKANSLLQAQARLPMTSPFEMKGLEDAIHNDIEIHQLIVKRLKSNPKWCSWFRGAFPAESTKTQCSDVIEINNITLALASYQASLVFINNPLFRFLKGKENLNEEAKAGAQLFFNSTEKGGLGCAHCHSGNHFSDERFYNLGVIPSGPGANGRGLDYGRKNINPSAPPFTFRTPGLLNVSETSPYFHNGSAASLADAIRGHTLTPPLTVEEIADSSQTKRVLTSIRDNIRSNAEQSAVRKWLPEKLSEAQIHQLAAFLHTLTDPCLLDKSCLQPFIDDEPVITPLPERNHTETVIKNLSTREHQSIKLPDYKRCPKPKKQVQNSSNQWFREVSQVKGLSHHRKIGLIKPGWIMDVINWGGISAYDLNNDCLDDLVFNDNQGRIIVYYQQTDGSFDRQDVRLPTASLKGAITPLVVDIDGDYQPDLFLGNDGRAHPQIIFNFLKQPESLVLQEIAGPALNASFGDLDRDGDLDMVLAFWRTYKSARQPQVWRNTAFRQMIPASTDAPKLRKSYGNITLNDGLIHQKHEPSALSHDDFTFTPNFADINGDGIADILMTADFFTTQLWKNTGQQLEDVTDIKEINGSFGMGAAIADFDNDGDLDWFESSIFSLSESSSYSGNRLYENQGQYRFKNISEKSGLSKGGWGWGSCAADFNNDGLLDIFHTTGYGNLPKTATYTSPEYRELATQVLNNHSEFQRSKARLFINQGNMRFKEQALSAGITQEMDGRGISCFDYQQDGDIDIVVANWEGRPLLFENLEPQNNNWLSLRLIGPEGNTEALGAKVRLHTSEGVQYREVRFENNYVSANPRQQHFGLDQLNQVEKLEILWPEPDTVKSEIIKPAINQQHLIYHPSLNKR